MRGAKQNAEAMHPATMLQTCIEYLIRKSLDFAKWKAFWRKRASNDRRC